MMMPANEEETVPPRQYTEYSFSFAGCGFKGVYHIGVLECLEKFIPHILAESRLAGASAGALVACCHICKVPLETTVRHLLELMQEAYRYNLGAFDPNLKVNAILFSTLDAVLPEDAHVLCSGRLHISVTRLQNLDFIHYRNITRNDIISEFSSRQQLIETLLYSSYIPVFSGSDNPVLDKEITMDGAFSNNLPRIDEDTVLVCPLAGESHICPQDPKPPMRTVTMSNNSLHISPENIWRLKDCFFLPPPDRLMESYHSGYIDALLYLLKKDLIRCEQHQTSAPHQECAKCQECVSQAAGHYTFSLDHSFESFKTNLPRNCRGCASFSLYELTKVALKVPVELLRVVPMTLKLGYCIIRHQLSAVKQILRGKEFRDLLKEYVGDFSNEGSLLKTILFRGNILLVFKIMSSMMHLADYTLCSRLYIWGETFLLELLKAFGKVKEQRQTEDVNNNTIEVQTRGIDITGEVEHTSDDEFLDGDEDVFQYLLEEAGAEEEMSFFMSQEENAQTGEMSSVLPQEENAQAGEMSSLLSQEENAQAGEMSSVLPQEENAQAGKKFSVQENEQAVLFVCVCGRTVLTYCAFCGA